MFLKLPGNKIRQLRRNVGVIFQDLKLLHDRTVGENVMLPLQFSGVSESDAESRAEKLEMHVGWGRHLVNSLNNYQVDRAPKSRYR